MATTISCTLKETGRKSSFSMLVATAITRNVVHHSAGEFMQLLPVVAADPTLPRTKSVRCAVCDHPEAVFFQAMSRSEEGMTLFFVCCNPNCGYRWRD
ncbi:DNA-directed RNA polymerases II, IV and V subunit 9A-like isoform X2 [Zingiber officinale]|uniref:DNA-directed RNA polymerases II, IV and V subunit 9A-like isoform X2 n=1 Tax=Zingiber officinale TaxID=94328 RepID=UPI001C4B234C|nr:DNA-directed RNA polymerases II, IV and V subunit 9A-like isoform X2 [Zingiber officinale]